MNKSIFILFIAFALAACAGGTNPQTDLNTTSAASEPASSAQKRPYSNLMTFIPVEVLAERADHVLYGEVKAVTGAAESLAPDIHMPVSTVSLSVREALKGEASGTFTFKSLGAEIDRSPYFSEDMARFTVGETVVVFLKDFAGTILPVGHVQGKVAVRGEDELNDIKDKINYEK